jgi:hypothetical protein
MREAGPKWGTSSRLLHELAALHDKTEADEGFPSEVRPEAFPELLSHAVPHGFDGLYLILDVPSASEVLAPGMQQLFSLTTLLATKRIYVKLFLPEHLGPFAGELPGCETVILEWDAVHLSQMIRARIRAAGGESLSALCGPDVAPEPSLDTRLVQASAGSPRELVRLGNRLLEGHALHRPILPRFTAEEVNRILGPPARPER